MPAKTVAPATIAAYVAGFPPEMQARLNALRAAIHAAAPQAEEAISYKMPTFRLAGNLVYFAVFKQHIGLYPVPAGDARFQAAIAPYRGAKSSLRFPHAQPLPLALIRRVVRLRVKENLARAKAKAAQK